MRLYVSEAGARLPGSVVRWLACSLSLVLAVTLLTGPPTPAVAAETGSEASAEAALVKSRPDVVSAAVTARAQGKRVEVEGLRTETETTFANPDGTMTTDSHLAPVRYQDDEETWHKVDLDLGEDQAGTVSPEATATDLTLAGGEKDASGKDGTDLARVVEPLTGDREAVVAMQAPGELGEPTLEANTATYEDVTPGADLFVRSTQRGFEQQLVLNAPEAIDEYTGADGVVSWRIPVRTKGVTARAEDDGSVSFVTGDGTVVSRVVAPLAWDAEVDEKSGDPTSVADVDLAVERSDAGTSLVVTPDQQWVKSPERQFPITIDPTYASGKQSPSFDTHVSSASPNSSFGTSSELRVGTYNGGGDKTRSFINFPIGSFRGRDITSAKLNLYETWSYSCSAREFGVRSADTAGSGSTWNDQPSAGNLYDTVNTAKGFSSSCAASWVRADITSMVRIWSTRPSSVEKSGLRLSASETDSYGWKKFASQDSTRAPYISFTYNRPPGVPSAATVDSKNAASYAPPGGSAETFTNTLTPTVSVKATDPDASRVKTTVQFHSSTAGSSSSLIDDCTTPLVGSGTAATCKPGASLGLRKVYVRSKAVDERGLGGAWSGWTSFTTTSAAPPVPSITCPDPYGKDSWNDENPGADITCTITAADGTLNQAGYVDLTVDGSNTRVKITPSSSASTAKTTVTISKAKTGYHSIEAAAVGRGGRVSAKATYGFGWGGASLTTPSEGASSSSKITVKAGSAPRNNSSSVTATLQWRPKNSDGAWENGPTLTTNSEAPASDPVTADGTWNPATAITYGDVDLPTRTPVTLEIQVCFSYSGSSTRCTGAQSPTTITRLPHAFGDGYPTTSAGTGELALMTGELSESETDASVPGFSSDLTISRSHLSFAGSGAVADWPSDPATSIFGPGFTANLDGPEAGASTMQVIDNTRLDGTIVLQDGDGEVLVYGTPSAQRTYGTGAWEPVTDETAEDGSILSLTGSGANMILALKDVGGTTTQWKPVTYSGTAQTTWKPVAVTEIGQSASSTFTYDGSSGRVTSITAAVPEADCSSSATAAAQRGCRALVLTYGTSNSGTDATPGDRTGQVKQISTRLWNPATSALETTPMTSYAYDGSGRLRTVTDERTNLTTAYTWVGSGSSAKTRIATVKPAGLAAWSYSYDSDGKLATVERANPTGSGVAVTTGRYAYDVPVSATNLPALSSADTVKWLQASPPATGYAVFGPDYTGPVSGDGVDWTYADLQYVDAEGYTVNTASYGAGAWQVSASDYDQLGHVVRELDASAINTIRAAADDGADASTLRGLGDSLSTKTVYNEAVTAADGTVVLPAGTVVTDVYEPAHPSVPANGGEPVSARQHTRTVYDEGAPNGGINPATDQRYALPTTVTVGAADSGASPGDEDIETISVTKTGYAKVDANDSNEGDGWALGAATSSTIAGATSITRYDTLGRTIESRQPMSNGNDAGTTRTSYYTAGANTADAACGNKPQWVGLECRSAPAADPVATGTPAGGASTLPATITTYDKWLNADKAVETSGNDTRTTTTTYDAAGRTIKTVTTASIAGSTAVPGTFTKYQASTGLVDYTGKLNSAGDDATGERTTYTYDAWGRETQRTNDLGDTVTTAYDTSSRPVQVTDPQGTTTTTYDSGSERRGMATSTTVSRASGAGGALTFEATYDADGNMVSQTLPGGITQTNTYDTTGNQTGLVYSGQVTSASGETSTGPWIGFSQDNDVTGRVRFDYTSDGAATGNDPETVSAGQAGSFNRAYVYNAAGRLSQVDDRTTAAGGEDADPASTSCTRRDYAFDENGRRTSLKTGVSSDGTCASGTTTTSYGYDTGDRPTTGQNGSGAYVYDTFGRQTTIPAADAPNGANAEITLGYFDTDAARSITQGGVSTTFTLDAAGRRSVQSTTKDSATTTVTRHYSDDSDNPAWSQSVTGNASSITRYAGSIGGDLGVTIDSTGTKVALGNLHGDTVTTVTIPNGQAGTTAATAIDGWSDYTEYGTPRDLATSKTIGGPLGYGWLGQKQRSATDTTAGLTLMGARLYNPIRGLFSSIDPVDGGSDSAYAYPTDPINQADTTGLWWKFKRPSLRGVGRHLRRNWKSYVSYGAAGACIVASAGVCAGAAVGAAALSGWSNARSYRRGKISGRRAIASTAYDVVGVRFRAMRGYYPRHTRLTRSLFGGNRYRWASTSHRVARRSHPYRYAARGVYNLGSIYKTYRGW